jgi:hypothetical protein
LRPRPAFRYALRTPRSPKPIRGGWQTRIGPRTPPAG